MVVLIAKRETALVIAGLGDFKAARTDSLRESSPMRLSRGPVSIANAIRLGAGL